MKKARKKPNPELRIRIQPHIFRALKLAVVRSGARSPAGIVESALCGHPMVASEIQSK